MSQFVDDCRKEWKRLGVPEPLSNEMAADLEADLAEAASEGVSPEEVLGNGYFDATSFAASWAVARGVGHPRLRVREKVRLRSWTLAVSALAFIGVAAAGLVVVGRGVGSVSVAAAALRDRYPGRSAASSSGRTTSSRTVPSALSPWRDGPSWSSASSDWASHCGCGGRGRVAGMRVASTTMWGCRATSERGRVALCPGAGHGSGGKIRR